jgi:GPI mannosyltransferase 1 subunit M
MTRRFWTPTNIFASAAALRLILLLYGLVQDAISPLKYTDIDYFVFTGAARYVARGLPPYYRETYRYTPLLAWLLLPTTWNGTAWFSFGKVIFAIADVGAGWFLLRILRMPIPSYGTKAPGSTGVMSEENALKFASVWILNPMVAQISTRGSSEGLLGVMVAGLLWAVLQRRIALAGFFLGLAVHFKIYPFIYAPSLVLYLGSPLPPRSGPLSWLRSLVNPATLTLALTSLLTFGALSSGMYALYGQPFLQHTYLHHLTRIDHRHNFSPYNTLLYASSAVHTMPTGPLPAFKLESLAFLPQLILSALLIPLALARRHLPGAMLAQTWAFVALNKVCTSQYFLWYLVLLPLYLPISSFLQRPYFGVTALVLWVMAQVLWIQQAYQLEFLGRSTFVPGLWVAGLVFYAVNMGILGVIVEDIRGANTKSL